MDATIETVNPNPRENSGIFSIIFLGYTWDIFRKGYKRKLEAEDIYNPLKSDRSTLLGDKLERNWEKQVAKAEITGEKPSLTRAILATFWPFYVLTGVLHVFDALILRNSQPILLGMLLDYFNPYSVTTKEQAFFYAGGLVAVNFVNVIIMNQSMVTATHVAMKVRVAVSSLIYRKTLKLSKTALGNTAAGKIVNLLSNDVKRFDVTAIYIHTLWVASLVAIVLSVMLFKDSQYLGFIGYAIVVAISIFQTFTANLAKKYRSQTAPKTDERIRLMDEIISGIQIIKMYAWEKSFEKIVKLARSAEIKSVTKSSYVRAGIMVFNLFTTRCALFFTILAMVLTKTEITASKVFVMQAYLNIFSLEFMMATRSYGELSELWVSIKRIRDFLLENEFKDANPPLTRIIDNGEAEEAEEEEGLTKILELKDLTVKHSPCSADNALSNINLSIPHGHFLGIIGPVGSGKSSLLQTFLGELKVIKGDIKIRGTMSYASQEPWIFDATVRQNIVFGQEYDEGKYNEVIEVCALKRDFQQFENGDLTIVGDRGAKLSGGQKARINLARAVYNDADIYLLDDPLSAVDIHVSKQLYDNCIKGYLSEKIRILVTHQVHYLKDADHIVILKNGHIEAEGTFNVLANGDNKYARLLTVEPPQSVANQNENPQHSNSVHSTERTSSTESNVSELISSETQNLLNADNDTTEEEMRRRHQIQLRQMEEGSSEGTVEGNIFFKYFLAGSNMCVIFFVIALFLACQLSASGVDYFIGYWMALEEERAAMGLSSEQHGNVPNSTSISTDIFNVKWSKKTLLYIYVGGIAMLLVTSVIRSVSFYKIAMLSSKNLHNLIFKRVIGTTMRFFETNPDGRILNRFSKDMGCIDESLPKFILDSGQLAEPRYEHFGKHSPFFQSLSKKLGIFLGDRLVVVVTIVVADWCFTLFTPIYLQHIVQVVTMVLSFVGCLVLIVIINPYILLVIVLFIIIFGFIRHVYLKSSKNIKRLEAIMISPLLSHVKASIEGLTTIRAYKKEFILTKEFDQFQDHHTSACYMSVTISTAFGIYMDLIGSVFGALQTFCLLLLENWFHLQGGEVGLAITQAMAINGVLQYSIRTSAEVENQLTNVERVLEYGTLPKEIEPAQPIDPPIGWPSKGEIVFINMGMRYYEGGPLTLKNLNLTIKPKEKVGIVGRTGAGKSSLITALFRLANVEGSIIIDGIDTKEIILENLRSKISIIPQDPVLFSGTLKYNLDPFGEYADEDLLRAIESVELKDPSNAINQLEYKVMDRGSNYSVGQRQLICLARAILKNNKILVLDEATANVDPQTDKLIQKTIRTNFVDCTVLTVAHRLNTITDSDKVLVMDSGAIVEFDHPSNLLSNRDGVFYKMSREAETQRR